MLLLKNKRANHDYAIGKTFLAGVVLSGAEVKSLRGKSGSFVGSYVKVLSDEIFLINAQITPYKYADNLKYDPKRTRKLLLRKQEIASLTEELDKKNKTLVPLSFEALGRNIKLRIGVGTGLKLHDKRAKLKKATIARDIAKDLKFSGR
ncbi:SsrA-binding protein SmpB [Candidatus Woesebacteria bacterium]|nr:SsrA-binding protein SmpB [Candidatus Woesebacteria bacterium]